MTRKEILKEYPYSTKITASYQVVVPKEHDKHLALASIDSLGELLKIPKEQIENNPDLQEIVGNGGNGIAVFIGSTSTTILGNYIGIGSDGVTTKEILCL